MRVIEKEENAKLEKQGHTSIYIKFSNQRGIYFDCNLELYNAQSSVQNSKEPIVLSSMESASKRFNIDSCSIYRLQT